MWMLLDDAVVVAHAAFILWVACGVFFLRRFPRVRLVHLASVAYGLAIEVWPWVCPLTHAEAWLRRRAGAGAYEEDFLVHYLGKLIYLEAPRGVLVAAAATVVAYTVALNWRWRSTGPMETTSDAAVAGGRGDGSSAGPGGGIGDNEPP